MCSSDLHKYIIFLFRFPEPTLLEKVVLQSHDWKMVLQEERICSIDFMESTFYVIILDPQIQDLIHLGEKLNQYSKHYEDFLSLDVSIPNEFQIDVETVPYGRPISLIRAIFISPVIMNYNS